VLSFFGGATGTSTSTGRTFLSLLSHFVVAFSAFHLGFLFGHQRYYDGDNAGTVDANNPAASTASAVKGVASDALHRGMQLMPTTTEVEWEQQQGLRRPPGDHSLFASKALNDFGVGNIAAEDRPSIPSDSNHPLKPQLHSLVGGEARGKGMFAGTGYVPRDDFASLYDIGVPLDPPSDTNRDVVILYQTPESMPNATTSTGSAPYYYYGSAKEATENCHEMKLILTRPTAGTDKRSCVAIMGQWESYYVHKFLRLPDGGVPPNQKGNRPRTALDSSNPLKYVSRETLDTGRTSRGVPSAEATMQYWKMLTEYLTKLPETLERLKPLAEKAASGGDSINNKNNDGNNGIVVMVVNYGQASLFFNFVCNARARGIDLSNVLLFATDRKTADLASSLGIVVFDVGDAFGAVIPEAAAKVYGDRNFLMMMLAKVYCVHLVNHLGYDLLFSDVDMVWRRHPFDFFYGNGGASTNSRGIQPPLDEQFDMYFQDDGARTARYAPYSPNTGFYFVRYNERTAYFFNVFVRMGDMITTTGTHQAALNTLLAGAYLDAFCFFF